VSLLDCVKCVQNVVAGDLACEACSTGAVLSCPTCVYEVTRAYQNCTSCADQVIADVLAALGVPHPMATCADTHSSKVQGAGLCCAAVASGQLGKTIGSTTLVTTANGKCAHCNVVAGKGKRTFGKPVLQFRFGGPGCPTAGTGCCALRV
jgi:hypothetical protein